MYEPLYVPKIYTLPNNIANIRFALSHSCEIAFPNSKNNDPLHLHQYWEIYLHLSSEVSFLANDHLYTVKKGDVLLTAAGNLHMRLLNAPTKQEHYCFWLDVPKDSVVAEVLHNFQSPHIQLDTKRFDALCFLFSEIEKTIKTGDNLYLYSLVLQVICALRDTSASANNYVSQPSLLQSILTDINENCAEIHSVKQLCERHYISPATLNRLFQKHLHISPHAFLESNRLAVATKHLSNGESVTNACMYAGFSDCSHFIVLFKKKFGVTPNKYKQKAFLYN